LYIPTPLLLQESAFSGTEVDPCSGTTTEEHLQGDIAFAFKQFWGSTNDLSWLKAFGYPVIEGIAQFWASKATKNSNGSFSIPHIMGPDEYHGDVTDSVYCNVVARFALLTAYELAPTAGVAANSTFKAIADNLLILFDATLQYHPEFAGYKRGVKVKQADTIMLGYPLLDAMPDAVRKNDLDYYQTVTDQNGPAMTWSMFAMNYGDIGEDDTAASFFSRGYQANSLGAFHDWHEVVGAAGADNFITGAGGFMQSVWGGYGGVRFMDGTLRLQRPRPPPNCTSIQLERVSFRGATMTMTATAGGWSLMLDPMPTPAIHQSSLGRQSSLGLGAAASGGITFSVLQDGQNKPVPLTSTALQFPGGSSATVTALSSRG
jgi:trehalose/maltose hydrolase-like predicted phosphorylase